MAKSDGSPNKSSAPALEFETLKLDDACRFVNVLACESHLDLGLWFHHSDTARWLHWNRDLRYWVPSLHGPTFWREDYWWHDDEVLRTEDLNAETASHLFPGCIPVAAKIDKRMEAKRRKIRKEKAIANTDVQTFLAPMNLPRGFSFLDEGSRRTFQHGTNQTGHASGRVHFVEGPAYFGSYWVPGDDPNTRISRDSRRFLDKNEAQEWVIQEIGRLAREERVENKTENA